MSKRSSRVIYVPARRRPRHSQLPTMLITALLTILFLVMLRNCLTFGQDRGGGSTFPSLPDLSLGTDPTGPADPTPADPTSVNLDPTANDDLYYYHSQLSEADQARYDQILTCLQTHAEQADLPDTTADQLRALFLCVTNDHPELFWVSNSYSHSASGGDLTFYPDYNRTEAETSAEQALVDNAIQTAMSTIGQPGSEYETMKAVYEYIVRTVDYVSQNDDQNIVSSLVDHTSVCAGYSRGMQLLLQQYGIQTIYVTGQVIDGGPHAWLVVRVDGSYYNVDVTFADRNGENAVVPDELDCDYFYLCTPDDLFYQDRLQDAAYVTVPSCTAEDLEYYRMNGRYFTNYDAAVASMEQSLRSGETSWDGQFSTPELYHQFFDAVANNIYLESADEAGLSASSSWFINDDDTLTITCWYAA